MVPYYGNLLHPIHVGFHVQLQGSEESPFRRRGHTFSDAAPANRSRQLGLHRRETG